MDLSVSATVLSALSLQLRPVRAADLGAVLEVYRNCEDFLALGAVPTASPAMVLRDVEQTQHKGGIFCGILTAQDIMVGVVEYIPSPLESNPECAALPLLMLVSEYRGRGIGAAVVAAVEADIRRASPVTSIVTWVQVNNPRALVFWQRHGYRVISGPERRPDQTTVLTLRKDLSGCAAPADSLCS